MSDETTEEKIGLARLFENLAGWLWEEEPAVPTSLPVASSTGNEILPISPEELCNIREHGCYVALSEGLGIQTLDFEEYLRISGSRYASTWTFGPYTEEPLKNIPAELHNATVITEALLGYPAMYLAQKSFAESSFRSNAKASGGAYGWQGLKTDATMEGLFYLKEFVPENILMQLIPEVVSVDRSKSGERLITFTDDADISKILEDVRTDPLKSTLVAAAYNRHYIDAFEKSRPSDKLTSLHAYCVHFFGKSGAVKFFDGLENNPNGLAYEMYPDGLASSQVKANKNIFINPETKAPRNFSEVAKFFKEDKNFHDYPLRTGGQWASNEGIKILHGEEAIARYQETGGAAAHAPKPRPQLEEPMTPEQVRATLERQALEAQSERAEPVAPPPKFQ